VARILVVEDDPDLSREFALYLRSEDGGAHDVEEVGSATAAVEALRRRCYDLVLLDVMMPYSAEDDENPEIDDAEVDYGRKMGLHVYRKARMLGEPPRIGLITVVREAGVLVDFPDAVGVLAKYFPLDDLGRAVADWLERPGSLSQITRRGGGT